LKVRTGTATATGCGRLMNPVGLASTAATGRFHPPAHFDKRSPTRLRMERSEIILRRLGVWGYWKPTTIFQQTQTKDRTIREVPARPAQSNHPGRRGDAAPPGPAPARRRPPGSQPTGSGGRSRSHLHLPTLILSPDQILQQVRKTPAIRLCQSQSDGDHIRGKGDLFARLLALGASAFAHLPATLHAPYTVRQLFCVK